MAEIVLPAGVEGQVGRHDLAGLLKKADQAAEVVVMAVAEDQRVDLAGVDAQELHVVVQRLGCVTEVE